MAAIMDTLSRPDSNGNRVALGGSVAQPLLKLSRLFDDSPDLMGLSWFNDAVARAQFTPSQSGGAVVAVNMR